MGVTAAATALRPPAEGTDHAEPPPAPLRCSRAAPASSDDDVLGTHPSVGASTGLVAVEAGVVTTAAAAPRDSNGGDGDGGVLGGKKGRVEHGLELGVPDHQGQVGEGPAAAQDLGEAEGGALDGTPGKWGGWWEGWG